MSGRLLVALCTIALGGCEILYATNDLAGGADASVGEDGGDAGDGANPQNDTLVADAMPDAPLGEVADACTLNAFCGGGCALGTHHCCSVSGGQRCSSGPCETGGLSVPYRTDYECLSSADCAAQGKAGMRCCATERDGENVPLKVQCTTDANCIGWYFCDPCEPNQCPGGVGCIPAYWQETWPDAGITERFPHRCDK